jgi:hypothetical protein
MSEEEWEGPVHEIVVTEVSPPDPGDPYKVWELDEYEIKHLPECPQVLLTQSSDDDHPVYRFDCALEDMASESSIGFTLAYSGTRITKPGTYKIRYWGNKTYCYDYGAYEYDAGICLAGDEDDADLFL